MNSKNAVLIARHTREHGGCTFTSDGEILDLRSGYVTGVYPDRGIVAESVTLNSQIFANVMEIVRRNPEHNLFGTWLDGDTLYVDLSRHYMSEDDAIVTGYSHNQLCIWDCARQSTIDLTRDYGYSVVPNRYGYLILYRSFVTLYGEIVDDMSVPSLYFQAQEDTDAIRRCLPGPDCQELSKGWPVFVADGTPSAQLLSDYFGD